MQSDTNNLSFSAGGGFRTPKAAQGFCNNLVKKLGE
jgi:hypothetical protein